MRWMSRSLGGLPTAREVLEVDSADVGRVYARAEGRARGQGETTLVAVGLVDVELLLRGEGLVGGGTDYESFSHTFVMVVGPEGVRVVQAWGEHGYSLGENLASSASKVRTWEQGREYVRDFENLCAKKGGWSREINGLYLKLFGVDVTRMSQSGGPMRRGMTPKFRGWARVKEGRDVRVEDVKRWEAVLDAIDARFQFR
ncbi:hypothetical protein OF83DRAFT_1060689 [Amylostereum chailletii]|nr:hypothetical protein OF83DRAFT_1060689 [Amylostereum chailletii]